MSTAILRAKPTLCEVQSITPHVATPVIQLENVSKTHPDGTVAVDGVSLTIPNGTIFGLLGPNGAGKTTLINMICGLLSPTSGRVLIAGKDPQLDPKVMRYSVGAQLQGIPFQQHIRVYEVLRLFSKFYPKPLDVEKLLEFTGLEEKKNSFCTDLSGGEKQRLSIARALVGNPEVLILDEPTTGLDTAMRYELLTLIEDLRSKGRTVLITTHYIEEAERLCDLVAVMNSGRLQAVDSPAHLVTRFGHGESLKVRFSRSMETAELAQITGARSVRLDPSDSSFCVLGDNAELMLQSIITQLGRLDARLEEARVIHSGLEEAYLNLLGEEVQ